MGDRFYLLDSDGHLWVLPRDNLQASSSNTMFTIDSVPLKVSEVLELKPSWQCVLSILLVFLTLSYNTNSFCSHSTDLINFFHGCTSFEMILSLLDEIEIVQ